MINFFKRLREKRRVSKEAENAVIEFMKRQEKYISLDNSALAALPEEELFDAVLARVWNKEGFPMNTCERAFFLCSSYESEVYNGGLGQYFTNSSREGAAELAEALDEIGADEHCAHYLKFIRDNKIDRLDADYLDSEDFLAAEESFDYESYDRAFNSMKPIRDYLTEYIKANIGEF